MSDAPAPVTKTRLWRAVVEFYVDDTPDPNYDVAACERLGDDLSRDLTAAIRSLALVTSGSVKIEHLEADA